MDFNASISRAMARYHEFFENPQPGQLLITIPPYTFSIPSRPGVSQRTLMDWRPFEDAEKMAEAAVEGERYFAQYTQKVQSD